MLLQDVFQSFEFERALRYSRMFFNLLTLSKTSWSNIRYAQSQKIEKHPGVRYAQSQQIEKHPGLTSGTLKVNRLKNILE
jgi:hypothetical protein